MKEKVKQGISKSIPVYWALIAPTVAFFLLLGTMFLYIDYSNKQSDQRWCKLLVNLDNRNQAAKSNPGITSDQLNFINNIHDLRQSLGC